MAKPQSPELARNRLGTQDQDGRELRVDEEIPPGDEPRGPVPEANQPGQTEASDQDKPDVPPHER